MGKALGSSIRDIIGIGRDTMYKIFVLMWCGCGCCVHLFKLQTHYCRIYVDLCPFAAKNSKQRKKNTKKNKNREGKA